jgi:hypothetical protein
MVKDHGRGELLEDSAEDRGSEGAENPDWEVSAYGVLLYRLVMA